MPTSPVSEVIQHLRSVLLLPEGADLTDGQLLECFVSRREPAALEALVRRHGPMVWGVCCRILGSHHDAEDAFQATFLVLIRKAASVYPRAKVASWLYGVAHRTALKARATRAKRRERERPVSQMSEPAITDQELCKDLQPLLDQEISRLPEKYRTVIVLCELEGKAVKEAARQLGCPAGTVASRLARGRALLAKQLVRRGLAMSGGTLAAVLSHEAAAAVPAPVLSSTIKAVTVTAAGQAAATGVISGTVAALTEGVIKAMLLNKLVKMTAVLLVAGSLSGAAGLIYHTQAAGAQKEAQGAERQKAPNPRGGDTKADAEAQNLVRQLGSPNFKKRQAAEKALADLGGRAAAAVRAGIGDADPEVARRCTALWPRLWQTEFARPDTDRLAGYTHPLWARFKKVAGDDASSRTLFAEMVADLPRFTRLEAAEADPDKAGVLYVAELKLRVETLKRAYREAGAGARNNTGDIELRSGIVWPTGIPTRGEFAALLFLGTYPSTAPVTYPEADADDQFSHHNVFGLGLRPDRHPKAIPRAVRRLFVAWLGTRTDNPDQHCMYVALVDRIAEVVPLARRKAADAALGPAARGFALLAVGHFGTPADRPLLQKAFADSRVFFTDKFPPGKGRPVEVRVSDTAVAAALHLAGQHPADFGFTLLERNKLRGPDILLRYQILGFFDDDARRAAYKKAKAWLDEHKDDKVKSVERHRGQAGPHPNSKGPTRPS